MSWGITIISYNHYTRVSLHPFYISLSTEAFAWSTCLFGFSLCSFTWCCV